MACGRFGAPGLGYVRVDLRVDYGAAVRDMGAWVMKKKEVRMVNGWRLATVILAMLIVIGVASLVGMYFVWRSEAHLALRQAKNVWTALRMVGIEYYGKGQDIYDDRTESGLKKEAEEQVRDVSECEGSIVVLGSSEGHLEPTRLLYREGPYLVYYYLDEKEDRQWRVYRAQGMFALDGSELKNFR